MYSFWIDKSNEERLIWSLIMIITVIMFFWIRNIIDNKEVDSERKEVKKDIDETFKSLLKEENNVINMMLRNVSELKEYYVISKGQSKKSFNASLFISFFGVLIYLVGIFISILSTNNILPYSIIAGSITQIIAGSFFLIYKNAISQLNIYHQRLGETEKYLIAIQLIEKISDDRKDEMYEHLMEVVLIDNSSNIRIKDLSNRQNDINTSQ